MPSNKFQTIAREIAKEDKAVFDALLEFEKTGKVRSKTRLNFTIDRSLAEKFRKYCREKGYNMSSRIEKSIDDIIKSAK